MASSSSKTRHKIISVKETKKIKKAQLPNKMRITMQKWRRKLQGVENKKLLCWLPVTVRMGGRTMIPFSVTRKRIKEKISRIIISATSVVGAKKEGKAPRLLNNRKKKRRKRKKRVRKKNLKLPLQLKMRKKNPRLRRVSATLCKWSTAVSAGCHLSTASGQSAATTSTNAKSGFLRPTQTFSNKSTRPLMRTTRRARTLPRTADSAPRRRRG